MKNLNKSVSGIVASMEDFFKKAPALPVGVKDFIVRVAPYLVVLGGIFGILGGLSNLFMPQSTFATAVINNSLAFKLSALLNIVASVLMVVAFPKLKARKVEGWQLLFWIEVINLISIIVFGGIISAIIGGLIGFYILFQVKSYYH